MLFQKGNALLQELDLIPGDIDDLQPQAQPANRDCKVGALGPQSMILPI